MASDGIYYLLFAAISLLSAAGGIVLTGYIRTLIDRRSARSPVRHPNDPSLLAGPAARPHAMRYEFRDGQLVTPTGPDDPFLEAAVDPAMALERLKASLGALGRDMSPRMDSLIGRGASFVCLGALGADEMVVVGYPDGDALVILVEPTGRLSSTAEGQYGALHALSSLSGAYRHLHDISDDLQWRETDTLGVTWANPTYLSMAEAFASPDDLPLRWPLPRIFEEQLDPPPTEGSLRRCQIVLPGREVPCWFEVRAKYVRTGEAIFNARPIDRLVQSETGLRDFVQTLSKTFANLPIGLAVFDRQRQLVMFNPALVAISSLEAGYLSGRPSLTAFLDQLRERQRMPEPSDYRTWRDEIARLEEGAASDSYHELWTLPSGDSLRVTGRPHPDGAIAFMFEDISREMTLTRRMRGDLGLWRATLDSAGDALVLADRDGRVTHVNAPYRALFWPDGPDANGPAPAGLGHETLVEAAAQWRLTFGPSSAWREVALFARHKVDRTMRELPVALPDGALLAVRIVPLAGGASAIWLRHRTSAPPLDEGAVEPKPSSPEDTVEMSAPTGAVVTRDGTA